MLVPLLRPVVSKVFDMMVPSPEGEEELVAVGPPDGWTETMVVGVQNQRSIILKPICLMGSGQSQDTVIGNWSKLDTIHIRSKHHMPMIIDRSSPLIGEDSCVPEMMFIQYLSREETPINLRDSASEEILESRDSSGKENGQSAELVPLVTI
eukprot:Protomagalhaensia_sp_Gyna_25__1029@NODE_149_length_4881_cov_201_115448_g115_i0_p3_GENE_NODE_149_length_4881_cov_201_115448_g115_i0NODE_149_length_4881_cov_201_115448_g115_i0_p3_ORF_typecomplete_len152_score17_96_NODE_149_length_4881_cov_201_115448_g115_i0445900